jgi:guanylate kinase
LVKRATDTPESIDKRMERAKEELLIAGILFQYHVINDNPNQAADEICEIILVE